MSDNASIADRLIAAVRTASVYNANVQVAPACILWPDGDRQWEPVIARLQSELPELCVLGDFAPAERTGPAIWLRLVIADKADEVKLPSNVTPILYLPGVRRQDLRAVSNCPEHLKPLAELQYRGSIWSQVNAKDWTIASFLQSGQGGLGLDVAQDSPAKNAMRLALFRLLDERIDLLEGKHLDKDYFNKLLTGGDPIRDLLLWIDNPGTFRESRDTNNWNAFAAICKSQLKFDPDKDGELEAAERLAERAPPWDNVWQRFADAPKKYPNIPAQIRKTKLPQTTTLFPDFGGWPQWNDRKEAELRGGLKSVVELPPGDARRKIGELERSHGERRQEVWAELGMSPLAMALEHLAALATITADSLAAGTAADMAAAYQTSGWQADDHLLRALAAIRSDDDLQAVTAVLRAVYIPWATDAAHYLQKIVGADGYPNKTIQSPAPVSCEPGTCFLFIDGLRLDLARRLEDRLEDAGVRVDSSVGWTALPSVTATAKPAITPVRHLIAGDDLNKDFTPNVAETGKSLNGGYQLQKLLEQDGWQRLGKAELGDPSGRAWCEMGDIDHEGHDRGWKLARHVDSLLDEVVERTEQLRAAGWSEIRIVTDHGWLLMPGGLPKTQLHASLSENKWGRCAALKTGAVTDEQLYHWFWNPAKCFALAEGISCYRSGAEYAHGGLSLQECLTMSMTLKNARGVAGSVEITGIKWKQLRCTVTIAAAASGIKLDIRTHAGNPGTSEVASIKEFKNKPSCSVIVEDEDLEGHQCWVVIVDADGNALAQEQTVVGGEPA
ncbi:MAG: BREX-1 system phosphatase PglZ type B [Pirellulales bacterium]